MPSTNRLSFLSQSFKFFFLPQIPFRYKTIPLFALLYFFSPVDIVPDFFVGLGQLDDLALILLALKLFSSLSQKYLARPPKSSPVTFPKEPLRYEEGVIIE